MRPDRLLRRAGDGPTVFIQHRGPRARPGLRPAGLFTPQRITSPCGQRSPRCDLVLFVAGLVRSPPPITVLRGAAARPARVFPPADIGCTNAALWPPRRCQATAPPDPDPRRPLGGLLSSIRATRAPHDPTVRPALAPLRPCALRGWPGPLAPSDHSPTWGGGQASTGVPARRRWVRPARAVAAPAKLCPRVHK